jgi:hypothetical protein
VNDFNLIIINILDKDKELNLFTKFTFSKAPFSKVTYPFYCIKLLEFFHRDYIVPVPKITLKHDFLESGYIMDIESHLKDLDIYIWLSLKYPYKFYNSKALIERSVIFNHLNDILQKLKSFKNYILLFQKKR